MKSIAIVVASLFAVSAFAQAPSGMPGKAEAKPAATASAPAKVEVKKDEKKPAKSEPAKKEPAKADAKAATPAK